MGLYGKYQALSPIYAGGLTNHLPMVLRVLEKFDVDKDLIELLLDKYKEDKGIFDLTSPSAPKNEFLEAYIIGTSHYFKEIGEWGPELTVARFLEKHIDAYPSGLFHGIIRLMFAVDSEEDVQVAQALAYFDLISSNYKLSGKPVDDVVSKLENNRKLLTESDFEFKTFSTGEKYQELLAQSIVKDNLVSFKHGELKSETLVDMVCSRYLETEDFYILHLITGLEAILSLEKYYKDFIYILEQYFLTAQVFMLFTTNKKTYEMDKTYSFEEMINMITTLEDAHDIKLFYSVYQLSKSYDNPKLLSIANRIFKRN